MIYSVYYFESLPTVRTSSQIARDHTLTSTMPSYICKGLSVSVWRQVSSSTGRDKQHGTMSTSQSSINQLSKRNHHYATALSLFYSPMYYMAYLRVQVLGNTVFLNTLERFWIGNEAKNTMKLSKCQKIYDTPSNAESWNFSKYRYTVNWSWLLLYSHTVYVYVIFQFVLSGLFK